MKILSIINKLIKFKCIRYYKSNTQFIINQKEEMHYSQKKNIQAFIQSKNEEIKSLKHKILGSKVTYEEMENAKSKLNRLRVLNQELQKFQYEDLKQGLKKVQSTVNEMVKKKAKRQQELETQQKEVINQNDISAQILAKKVKTQQYLKDMMVCKEKLMEKKNKRKLQREYMEEQVDIRNKQISMQKQIKEQLDIAKEQIRNKIVRVNKDLIELSNQNKKLLETVRKQSQEIIKLEHLSESEELKSQILQLKIQKQEKNDHLMHLKLETAQNFLHRFCYDKLIYNKQVQTEQNISSLLKMSLESSQKRQKEQKQCAEQIDELHVKIKLAENKRSKLLKEMNQKQESLKQMKEKGSQLKSILNSIFHQDSSVLKLIADKKVFQPQNKSKVTNQSVSPFFKHDSLDLRATTESLSCSK